MIKGLASACILACCSIGGAAQAALHDRGGGLIYDDVLNITWLRDANYSITQWNQSYGSQGGDVNGIMNWSDAKSWVASLTYFDPVRNVVWDDWRLPTTLQPDPTCEAQSNGVSYSYGCSGSELGHLFYVDLGGVAGQPITNVHNENFGLFTNWQKYWGSGESNFYWTSTEAPSNAGNNVWGFTMVYGYVAAVNVLEEQHVWAVRDGDVAAVPEPETYVMMLAGLLFIGLAKRHHNKTITR